MSHAHKTSVRCPMILPNGERCGNRTDPDTLGGTICKACSKRIDDTLEKRRVRKTPDAPASDDLEESS
jgi:hypothetical protein